MLAGRRVLLLGGSLWQSSFIQRGVDLGLDLWVLDGNPQAPGLAAAPQHRVVDIGCPDAVAAAARDLQPEAMVSGATDVGARTLAALGPQWPSVTPTGGEWSFLFDKAAVYRRLAASSVAIPRHHVVTDAPAAVASALALSPGLGTDSGPPVIVKPTAAAGGRGISLVRAGADVPRAFHLAHAAGRTNEVLIEEFIEGQGVGFEGMLDRDGNRVLGLILRAEYGADHPSPCGHAVPSSLPAAVQKRISALVHTVLTTLGIRCGSFNLDLRLRAGEPVFLELNPRAGGAAISELVRHTTGFDVATAMYCLALNAPVAPAAAVSRPGAVQLLSCHRRGTVRTVTFNSAGLPVIAQAIGIQPGDHKAAPNPWIGWVLTASDTVEHARAAARTAAARLDIGFARDP